MCLAIPTYRRRDGRDRCLCGQSTAPTYRVAIPGAAFIASIAYSAYLIQKLVINGVEQFCSSHNIQPTSALALVGVELCVYAAATLLFLIVERPFLQLRGHVAPIVLRKT